MDVKRFGPGDLLPYAVEEQPGTNRLLVCFPKLHPGEVRPPRWASEQLARVPGHRLLLGADTHTYVGPRRSLVGLQAAVALIHREAERLGVDRTQITTLGTSMGAICALYIGMRARVGRVISGGPPVNMGKQLRDFAKIDGPGNEAKLAAREFLALADNGDGDPGRYLDRMIYTAAEECPVPVVLDVLCSEGDQTFAAARKFVRVVDRLPLIDARLHLRDYARHGEVVEPFRAFLEAELGDEAVAQG